MLRMQSDQSVPSALTAMARTGLSRPMTLAIDHCVLPVGATVFDYGCGRGGDVKRLNDAGFHADGWDPAHAPDQPKTPADVVNLGYVLNVIEHPAERVQALREAWSLARQALVVAVRPEWEVRSVDGRHSGDGIVTAKGTFQKFFDQGEIRGLIEVTTATTPVAAAPGIFYVFRDDTRAQDFRARILRRRTVLPRATVSEAKFEQHRTALEPLLGFVTERGRLPLEWELPNTEEIRDTFGSIKAAAALVRRVEGDAGWVAARAAAEENLVVFLALAAFGGRPKMTELSAGLQADVRALFGSYKAACAEADRTLFGLGNTDHLDRQLQGAPVGKLLPDALYIHTAALRLMTPVLRLYEGCARVLVGDVEHANIIKLSRKDRRVSYLSYPDFDRDPHPALAESLRVDLQTFSIKQRDFRGYQNPPILHRKETFVPEAYPGRDKFRRLTEQEERRGLLDGSRYIGSADQWADLLAEVGVRLAGHRLVAAR